MVGHPLVYKAGAVDPFAVARELARAGARSGTLVLCEEQSASPTTDGDAQHLASDQVLAVLVLRPVMPRAEAATAAACSVAEVAQDAVGRACEVREPWDVVLSCDHARTGVCQIAVEEQPGATILGLWFAFEGLWAGSQSETEHGAGAMALVTRLDRREVILARVLHKLDQRLRAMHAA